MAKHPSSPIAIVVTHLNAPVGNVLTHEALKAALCAGTGQGLPAPQAALVSSVFMESSPSLILDAGREAGAPVTALHALYRWSLANGEHRVTAWEDAIEHLL